MRSWWLGGFYRRWFGWEEGTGRCATVGAMVGAPGFLTAEERGFGALPFCVSDAGLGRDFDRSALG